MSVYSVSRNLRENQVVVVDPSLEKDPEVRASSEDTKTRKVEFTENNKPKKIKFYPWNSTHHYGRQCGKAICFPFTGLDIKAGYKIGKTELRSSGQGKGNGADHLTQSLEVSLGTMITPYAAISGFYQMDHLKGDGVELENGESHINKMNIHTIGARAEATLPLHYFGLTAFGKIGKSYIFAETIGHARQFALPDEGLLPFSDHNAIQPLKWSVGAALSLNELVFDLEGRNIRNLFSVGYEYSHLHFKEPLQTYASYGFTDTIQLKGESHQFMINLNLRTLVHHILRMVPIDG